MNDLKPLLSLALQLSLVVNSVCKLKLELGILST